MVVKTDGMVVNHYRHSQRERIALARIYQQIAPDHFWSLQEVEDSLKKASVDLWYARQNQQWQGFLLAESIIEQGELYYLYVDPNCRGQGIGSLLLKHWLDVLATQKIATAFLEVRKSNRLAQSLYLRHGFMLVGCRPGYYLDGEDAYIYERNPSC